MWDWSPRQAGRGSRIDVLDLACRLVSRVATDRVKGGKLSHNDAVVQDDGGDGCQGVVQGDRSTVCEQKRVKLSMILR